MIGNRVTGGVEVMAKPRGRPKMSERDDGVVKMSRKFISMAKAIATRRAVPVGQVMDELCGGTIDRAYITMLRESGPQGGKS